MDREGLIEFEANGRVRLTKVRRDASGNPVLTAINKGTRIFASGIYLGMRVLGKTSVAKESFHLVDALLFTKGQIDILTRLVQADLVVKSSFDASVTIDEEPAEFFEDEEEGASAPIGKKSSGSSNSAKRSKFSK
jgi:hypothetical protein